MLRWFRKRAAPCKHTDYSITFPLEIGEYTSLGKELLGVSLSWVATPVPVERSRILCHLCGEEFTRDGYLPKSLWQRDYPPDENGWPTKDGEKIAIWPF